MKSYSRFTVKDLDQKSNQHTIIRDNALDGVVPRFGITGRKCSVPFAIVEGRTRGECQENMD